MFTVLTLVPNAPLVTYLETEIQLSKSNFLMFILHCNQSLCAGIFSVKYINGYPFAVKQSQILFSHESLWMGLDRKCSSSLLKKKIWKSCRKENSISEIDRVRNVMLCERTWGRKKEELIFRHFRVEENIYPRPAKTGCCRGIIVFWTNVCVRKEISRKPSLTQRAVLPSPSATLTPSSKEPPATKEFLLFQPVYYQRAEYSPPISSLNVTVENWYIVQVLGVFILEKGIMCVCV
jgi:hypothetical protein